MKDEHAVMICGHGSRDDFAVEEFNSLAFHLKNRLPDIDIESGFLEFAKPILRTGLEKLKDRGAKKIIWNGSRSNSDLGFEFLERLHELATKPLGHRCVIFL